MSFSVDLIVALMVAALPAGSGTIRLEVQHEGPLILGTVDEVPVLIHAPEVEDDRPLRVSVNVGSFAEVTRVEAGVFQSRFRLPKTRHPQVALVAVWRETGPTAPITFLRIPLAGKTTLPIGTRRGSKVTVLVGTETFGPIEANRRGRAVVPIVVPPGITEVIARSMSGTTESQKSVPVDLPPYNRLTLAVTPHQIEADGRSSCTAHVFYDSVTPPPMEAVRVTAPGGLVTPLGADGGHYTFRYLPERGKDAVEVELVVRVEGDRTSRAKTVLSLGSPVPQRLVIKRSGAAPVADGRAEAELQVLLMDKLGLGIAGRTLVATAADGRIGDVRDLGEGRYALGYVAPERYPAGGRTTVSIAVADRREVTQAIEIPIDPPPWPAQAFVSVSPAIPISDGSSFTVEVKATDFAGRPFDDGVVLTATAAAVSRMKPLGDGRYRAEVTPLEGAESIDLMIGHSSGRFSHLHRTELRQPPALLSIAAEIGGAYHSELIPTGAIELGLRPALGQRRVSLLLSAGFRQIDQEVEVGPPVLPADSLVSSQLRMFPISAGVAYDLFLAERWRFYVSAAFTLIPFEHRVSTELFDTPIERALGFGGEGALGFEWSGVFIEASGGYTRIRADDLIGPELLVALAAGYRFGVL